MLISAESICYNTGGMSFYETLYRVRPVIRKQSDSLSTVRTASCKR